MKTLGIIILLHLSFCSLGQTKKIAHRSHSGTNHTFSLASLDNFGNNPALEKYWEEERIKEVQKKAQEEATRKELEKLEKEKAKEAKSNTKEPEKVEHEEIKTEIIKTEEKEPKKARKERKKAKKKLKKSKKDEIEANSQVGQLPELTSRNTTEVLDNKTQAPKKSEASVNWILILLLIALPSTLAIKAINLKL